MTGRSVSEALRPLGLADDPPRPETTGSVTESPPAPNYAHGAPDADVDALGEPLAPKRTQRDPVALSAFLARLAELAAKRAQIAAEEAETLAEMARIGGIGLAGSEPESVSALAMQDPDQQEQDEPEPAEYMAQATLAAMLDTHPRTVRRMELEGELPAARQVGRLKRWRRAEIQDWLDEGCPKPRRARR